MPGSPVVLLGHRSSDDELFAAIQAGAAAHVLDDARPSELVRTIRAVADGEYLIDEASPPARRSRGTSSRRSGTLRCFARWPITISAATAFTPLSPRESEVLEAIARGMTNKDVADALAIGEQTVKNHVTSILRKLAVNGRTQAVLYALRKSWIGISDEPPRRRN